MDLKWSRIRFVMSYLFTVTYSPSVDKYAMFVIFQNNETSTFLETISDLEITLDNLFNWFCYNNFKVNASKCHLFLLSFNAKSINIKSSVIEGSSSEKFLGITIDSNFTFEKHINELCKKGNLKLHALTKFAKFVSTEKRRPIFKAFIIRSSIIAH